MASETTITAARAILTLHKRLSDGQILKLIERYGISGLGSRGGMTTLRTLNSILNQNPSIFSSRYRGQFELANPRASMSDFGVIRTLKKILKKELEGFQHQINYCLDTYTEMPENYLNVSRNTSSIVSTFYKLVEKSEL